MMSGFAEKESCPSFIIVCRIFLRRRHQKLFHPDKTRGDTMALRHDYLCVKSLNQNSKNIEPFAIVRSIL
jgi:hypothetical protein